MSSGRKKKDNDQKRVYPVQFFSRTGTLKPSKKRTPRAITLLIVVKSILCPFISPFPTTTLAGGYLYTSTCPGSVWMAQVRLGSGLGRIRVPKRQSPGSFLWWQACVIYLVSVCACFIPCTINTKEIAQQSQWYVRGLYVCTCGRTYPGAHNGWIEWNETCSEKLKEQNETQKEKRK